MKMAIFDIETVKFDLSCESREEFMNKGGISQAKIAISSVDETGLIPILAMREILDEMIRLDYRWMRLNSIEVIEGGDTPEEATQKLYGKDVTFIDVTDKYKSARDLADAKLTVEA